MTKDKTLKDLAIEIKGNRYVMVKDRISYFNETYPSGSIQTKLISKPESDLIIIKATVYPVISGEEHDYNRIRCFTGYSQAVVGGVGVNATSALENAETSAVGRALAMMGIGVIDSVASGDEINKATTAQPRQQKVLSDKSLNWLREEAVKVSGLEEAGDLDSWLEELLTVDPKRLPQSKLMPAVELVRAAKEPEPKDIDPKLLDKVQEVTGDEEINLDNVPY